MHARTSTSQLVLGGSIPFSILFKERILTFKILHIAVLLNFSRRRRVLMLVQKIEMFRSFFIIPPKNTKMCDF